MKNHADALIFAHGYLLLLPQHNHVTAVDIIPEKVDMINNKKSPIQDDYIEMYLAEKELDLTATLDGGFPQIRSTSPGRFLKGRYRNIIYEIY